LPGEDFDSPADGADGCAPLFSGSTSGELTYHLVRDAAGLDVVLAALGDADADVGLDCEATGLSSRRDRVRLISVALPTIDGGQVAYLVDCFAVDPRPMLEPLAERSLLIHNAGFDLGMLAGLGFTPKRPVRDVMILSRLLTAGTREGNALADLTERYLGFRLGKEQQKSDWAAPTLSKEQLDYAAADVVYLAELHRGLDAEVRKAGLTRTAEIEARCLPAWVWMAAAGMTVDRDAWLKLAQKSRAERDRLRDVLATLAPPRPNTRPGVPSWNFNSQPQVKEILRLLGFEVANVKGQTLAGIEHPFVDAFREYTPARWLDSTYGEAFLRFVHEDGRVYGVWNQTGNEAGRSSCKGPNLQGIPRREEYRRAFVAPPGRVLIKADYAAAHLRIAAKIAGEEKMLDAFQAGRDLHRITAQALLGKQDISKQDRQLAKAVAFGLLYGMGAKGLRAYARESYGVDLTLAEAARHRRKFFATYPGLARWHRATEAGRNTQTETRSLAGRRRLLDPRTPLMHRLNSPVLGTEGDAAKTALALLWERRGQVPGARPVAFIHDEILVEADADQADAAAAWLRQAMLDGMGPLIAPVPCEVEVQVGRTWAGEDGEPGLPVILPGPSRGDEDSRGSQPASGEVVQEWTEGEV
jgi:DNA polymerase-1